LPPSTRYPRPFGPAAFGCRPRALFSARTSTFIIKGAMPCTHAAYHRSGGCPADRRPYDRRSRPGAQLAQRSPDLVGSASGSLKAARIALPPSCRDGAPGALRSSISGALVSYRRQGHGRSRPAAILARWPGCLVGDGGSTVHHHADQPRRLARLITRRNCTTAVTL
jgi:hypothetical protein